MKNIIKTLLYEWKERKLPTAIERETKLRGALKKAPRKIITVSGFRRVGKTYLTFQLVKELLKKRTREEVIYINFEDERIPLRTEFLTQLVPTIRELFSKPIGLLVLDEIQNIPNWSKWLRRLHDTENFNILVTGSSSKLSSKEIPTELRGRSINIQLFHLSFHEFIKFKGEKFDIRAAQYSSNEKAKVLKCLNEYLKFGGLPEVVLADVDRKTELLRDYYTTVITRDIIERFGVKNETGLKDLLRLLLNSTYYSVSKLYNIMKSAGHKIGKTTLLNYISYIGTSYFLNSTYIFSRNMKDKLQYPKKIYFVDNGFLTALSIKFSKNIGRLYENQIFIELKRRTYGNPNIDISYWRDYTGKEVDFVVKEGPRIKTLIQSCYDVDDSDTRAREINSLLKASDELRCKNLVIITEDYSATQKINRRTIKFIPLWKWLLEPEI